MKQKICGLVYGVILTLVGVYIYQSVPFEITLKIYSYLSAFTFLVMCVLYPIGRNRRIDRNYKFRDKPRLIDDIRIDLKKNGLRLICRILFLTAVSPLSWFFAITGIIEEKFNLD